MSLIAQCMPEFSLRFVQRVAVEADIELAYLRLRALDLGEIPLVHSYLRLKALPKRVRAFWRGKRRPGIDSARLSDLVCRIAGVNLLGEQRRDELVFGAIGKFWQPMRPFERVPPQGFRRFSEPGFGKLALSLRVARRESGGTWISVELRGQATDEQTEAKMKRAWQVIGRMCEVLCRACLQRLAADLGPLVEDEGLRLPGDALLQDAVFKTTHALTLEVRPERVWSWLMRQSRSHALRGGHTPPIDGPAIGQRMPGLAGQSGDFVVVRAEPGRVLVLGSASLLEEHNSSPEEDSGWSTTWAFVLAPIGDDATRLFVRVRSSRDDKLSLGLLEPLMAAIHDTLERRHLDSLCRQAEGWAA